MTQRSVTEFNAPVDAVCWARWIERIEAERAAVASMLHSEVGGLLTVAGMHLQRRNTAAVRAALQHAVQQAARINREAAASLYPQLLQHLGLVVALQVALQERCDRSGLHLDLQLPDTADAVSSPASLALYRCAMAALDNIAAHAVVDSVQVQLACGADRCQLVITDAGRGCEPESAALSGGSLCALALWLRGLGGGLSLESAPGSGCCLRAWVPVAPSAAADGVSHS